MEILTTIIDKAKDSGFTVSIATGSDVSDLEDQVKMMHRQKRVDGFIILYSDKEDPVRAFLAQNQIPFVIVGAPTEHENQTVYIDNDNQLMGRAGVDYLHERGHERILFVTDDQLSEIYLERYLGYVKGVSKLRLPQYESHLFDRNDADTVMSLVEKIQREGITALIIIGDLLSLRIIQLLSYNGMSVPDDISLISFNNSVYSTMLHPYLTTFDINVKHLGRNSFMYLLDRIQGKEQQVSSIIVPFHLEERESVKSL